MMKIVQSGDKKVYLVAQELKLARVLAGNNKTSRDKALKNLKKWFLQRSQSMPFTEVDFQRIWTGLFYSMWMSDKPLIQEECADNISKLVHFPSLEPSLLFFKSGMVVLINEWFGIDQLRLDKFLMLIRRFLRETLFALKEHGLTKKNVANFTDILSQTILSTTVEAPVGLFMHFVEIFLEELAKVTKGNIDSDRLIDIVKPFMKKMVTSSDSRQISRIRNYIFMYLIKQTDLGLEYQAKYEAWKEIGFPGSINNMQKIKLDDSEKPSGEKKIEHGNKDEHLDPRAGRVDVELPQFKFNPKSVAAALLELRYDKGVNIKSRKLIKVLADQFTKLANGIYPLGVKKVRPNVAGDGDTNIRKATNRLIKFEKKLLKDSRGKNRKRKRDPDGDGDKTEVKPKRTKGNSIGEVKKVKNEINSEQLPVNKKVNDPDGDGDKTDVKPKRTKGNSIGEVKKVKNEINSEQLQVNKKSKRVKEVKNSKVEKVKKNETRNCLQNNQSIIGNTECVLAHNLGNEDKNNKVKKVKKNKPKRNYLENNQLITDNIKHVLESNLGDEAKNKVKRIKKHESKKNFLENNQSIIDNIECVFERNSGTWVVYNISKSDEKEKMPSVVAGTLSESGNSTESPSGNSNVTPEALGKTKENPIRASTSSKSFNSDENYSKSGPNPVKLFESSPKEKELFHTSEWEKPLQEGEYEICIPSKKYATKMKKIMKKTSLNIYDVKNTTRRKIRGKNTSLVKNPFSTTNNTKKVKINTKLNKSQEVHEHHAQILSSPGIPYDANKKPSKPLLKTSFNSTPINPFYTTQLSV